MEVFSQLPDELVMQIFEYVNDVDTLLHVVPVVCSRFYYLMDDLYWEEKWKKITLSTYPPESRSFAPELVTQWKLFFFEEHARQRLRDKRKLSKLHSTQRDPKASKHGTQLPLTPSDLVEEGSFGFIAPWEIRGTSQQRHDYAFVHPVRHGLAQLEIHFVPKQGSMIVGFLTPHDAATIREELMKQSRMCNVRLHLNTGMHCKVIAAIPFANIAEAQAVSTMTSGYLQLCLVPHRAVCAAWATPPPMSSGWALCHLNP